MLFFQTLSARSFSDSSTLSVSLWNLFLWNVSWSWASCLRRKSNNSLLSRRKARYRANVCKTLKTLNRTTSTWINKWRGQGHWPCAFRAWWRTSVSQWSSRAWFERPCWRHRRWRTHAGACARAPPTCESSTQCDALWWECCPSPAWRHNTR